MPYHRLAHLDTIAKYIKSGVKIRRGDSLGTVGKSGTHFAHLHYAVMRSKPERWTQYVFTPTGPLTKEQMLVRYFDPTKWIDKAAKIPAAYTTYGGYEFLDPINTAGTAYHEGMDINDRFGDQDLGNPIRSPCTGEIVYVGRNDGGFGNQIWIYEDDINQHPAIDMTFAKNVAGRMFLAVEANGEVWYIDPDGVRYYMGGSPDELFDFIKKMAVGISNADLNKIPKG